MTTNNHTIIFNGIELALKDNGTVEVFCDRPSIVRITDLKEQLDLLLTTSFGTEEASQTSSGLTLLHQFQHGVLGHTLELAKDPYYQRGL
tara:strand:- start:115 stop:384 length:270 start_codon:yes stop_codon:yes gene_type:complete